MSTLNEYVNHFMLSQHAQLSGQVELEEKLLDELDSIWRRLSREEREQVGPIARTIASLFEKVASPDEKQVFQPPRAYQFRVFNVVSTSSIFSTLLNSSSRTRAAPSASRSCSLDVGLAFS